MRVISTNLGTAKTFQWNGKEEQTGIFKYPTDKPIVLGLTDVENDTVVNRKHHAGENKACFLFGANQYPYWKSLYPHLNWDWGMFGENLTIDVLNEDELRIGDMYKIGNALVQVTQPREPCYKLGIRFNNQQIIKQYIKHKFPGTYIKILETGSVKKGDEMVLVKPSKNTLTINQYYEFLFAKTKNQATIQLILDNEALPAYKKEGLKKLLNKNE